MRAAVRSDSGLVIAEVDMPVPSSAEILVRVHAASLNRADLYLLDGRSHGPHGGVGTRLGLEWAGVVTEVGSDVTAFRPGDRVMCSGIGGFAEYAVADWRRAFALPVPSMDYETAACLTIALRTAHTAIVALGQLRRGQSVLVFGASSGVGLMSVQVARLLGAGLVIGTSTKADRRARLHGFGADITLDSSHSAWSERVLEATSGQGADLVVDFLAGPHVNDLMRATSLGGCIVNVGRMAGETGPFDFDLHSLRRIRYLGTTFRTRTVEEVGAIAERVRTDLWPALRQGGLRLPIDLRFPLERAAEAFEAMRGNEHFGKIVLAVD